MCSRLFGENSVFYLLNILGISFEQNLESQNSLANNTYIKLAFLAELDICRITAPRSLAIKSIEQLYLNIPCKLSVLSFSSLFFELFVNYYL